ncbi:hypothetical protein F2P81_024209 [Scophthalmus maximus]|uniref:Uncharacterized protein n=1 Tax=Scophthalmus maximus TaxID=52904 RepID=A0A6A4RTE6_SCOMX|nr:hypothetical protein F2P81_024209 [Scophthalmus maximus]
MLLSKMRHAYKYYAGGSVCSYTGYNLWSSTEANMLMMPIWMTNNCRDVASSHPKCQLRKHARKPLCCVCRKQKHSEPPEGSGYNS